MKLKTLLCTLSAAALCVSFAACSSKAEKSTDSAQDKTEATEEKAQSPTATVDISAIGVAGEDGVIEVRDSDLLAKYISEGTHRDKPAVIDFGATWCGPCQQFKPSFHSVAAKYKDKADFFAVDVDECQALANALNINSVPTIMFIPTSGEPISNVGLIPENEFEQQVKALK